MTPQQKMELLLAVWTFVAIIVVGTDPRRPRT
jgi:hypothetical protein